MNSLITRPLLLFFGTALIVSLGFRAALVAAIASQSIPLIVLVSVTYFFALFGLGLWIGRRWAEQLPFADVGFRFHLAVFLAHFTAVLLWYVPALPQSSDNLVEVLIGEGFAWSIALVIHFGAFLWNRRRTIGGLDRDELFE